ncbi:MAG: rhomboid family intramembrane serine protease [Bacteroidia bacterium]|nr:rhomboid family intramembrane serine protease [Bacteroidia bacterium]
MSIINDLKTQLRGSYRSVVILLIINISAFLLANILIHLSGMSKVSAAEFIATTLCVPGKFSEFITHFWTLFTYMFLHVDIWHLISNMLWLWFLGRVFSDLIGSKKLMFVYIMGGLAGGVTYLITSAAIVPLQYSVLLGASGSVMAIVVAAAVVAPDYKVYPFGIPLALKWLALISFILTTVLDLSVNTGGKAAHVGGAVFGLLYAYSLKSGNFLSGIFSGKSHLKVAHSRLKDEDYNAHNVSIRKRIDEILDKISRSGYDSLTRDEKDFLKRNHDKF